MTTITRDSPRIFTIEEVDDLIPTLSLLVGGQLAQQSEIERALDELARATGSLPRSLEAQPDDDDEVRRMKAALRELIGRYEEGWRTVQSMGVLIKDPQVGLLDFYGRIDGRLVYLCWRYGEPALGYYHEIEAGYAGRRALAVETREKLLN